MTVTTTMSLTRKRKTMFRFVLSRAEPPLAGQARATSADSPSDLPLVRSQVYKQLAQIPAGSARRDAMRLTRKEKARLPRVTAYCTST